MSVMIDIISSVMVGSMLVLIAMVTTHNGAQEFVNSSGARLVQMDLAQTTQIIQSDIERIGFGISEPEQETVLQVAAATQLKFLAHLNRSASAHVEVPGVSSYDNIPDTIEYIITLDESIDFGDTTVYLYNVQRTIDIASITSITSTIGKVGNNNVFSYLDQIGRPSSVNRETRMVELSLSAFNPDVLLSPELVATNEQEIEDINVAAANAERRKREVRRLLRGSYWEKRRLILRNLNG